MKRKGLFIIFSLLVVASLLASGAYAWFNDTEKSQGNTFTAGTLDLTVDGKDNTQVIHMVREKLVPNAPWSHSYGGQWILKNTGNVPGKFSVMITNVKNYENGCNNPEDKAGDVTCGDGIDQGELGGILYGKWSENYYNITPARGWAGSQVFNPINSAAGVSVDGLTLQPGQDIVAYLDLEWDTHAGVQDNLGQSDSLEFDVVFTLEQLH